MENKPKSKKGPLFKLKYMGYFLAGLDENRQDLTFKDFVRIAKFFLADERKILLKDPVWDSYSDEELLIEYYAVLYKNSEQARQAFESSLVSEGEAEDEFEWMDTKIEENRKRIKDLKQKAAKIEEEIMFDPSEETLDNG
jgi:hypothetical protein